jgi:hypothetical protein
MKTTFRYFIITILACLISFTSFHISEESSIYLNKYDSIKNEKIRSSSSPKAGFETKANRWDYFNRMLKDPRTNHIPIGIRQKELAFAKELEAKNNLNKSLKINDLGWKEAGPRDVGGRTRALAIDVTNSNTIIAGGVSGGIWKSTDKGATWQMKSTTSQILSVTSVVQDPRAGQTNTWYYATGEFDGTAGDQGYTHRFTGDGIYKSTDNGETWNLLPATASSNVSSWNSPFDYVYKIAVNPSTGTILVATQGFGIYRSTNGGNSFNISLGGTGHHYNSDVSVSANGTIAAVVSSPLTGYTPTNSPGVYKSTNDGQTWNNVTPANFPSAHYRNLVEIAPSNNNIAYVLSFTWQQVNNKNDDIKFFKINLANGTSEDRSVNMPHFNPGGNTGFEEWINTQGGYNFTLAVKPNDENFVLIGATSLYRSTNGFATKPNNEKQDWIGGYNSQTFFYPNLHPDIHSFAFEPNNPNAMWCGHDGGLSYTSNITTTNYTNHFPWENKNNGYNVTQFYTIAISDKADDTRIMGGTQDNGTPSFRFDGTTISESYDVSTGDGSYCYFGNNYPYVSAQNGAVIRGTYNQNGNPRRDYPNWSNITPKNAQGMLFINPFVVNPADENIMIYPAGNTLWRNNQLNSLPNNPNFAEGITTGWTQLNNLSAPGGYIISALTMSVSNPAHRLYYAASDFSQQPSGTPKIYRLDNANTATSGAVDISIPISDQNYPRYYIHNIAVNPDNANELMVVFSNYNIIGIYYSNNGGQSFTAVEGNLQGTEQNPGPSIRGAAILPTSGGTQYFVATSTGVYSTLQLNGANTVWSLEGASTIGNVVVNYVTSRKSDATIVAGTHGRGAFIAKAASGGNAIASVDVSSLTLQSSPGQTGSTSFTLSNTGTAQLIFNVSVTGNFGTILPKSNSSEYILNKADMNSTKYDKYRKKLKFGGPNSQVPKSIISNEQNSYSNLNKTAGDDVLYLDDGNSTADNFVGWGNGDAFAWLNEFNLSQNFDLDGFDFYMRTETASSNSIYAAIYNQNNNLLAEGYLNLNLASTGSWYTITLNPSLSFSAGETFYIEVDSYSFIAYPAGADFNATIKNKSYYFNPSSGAWVNLNTVSGFENGAFLIRARGTLGGGGTNQDPVAVANISKTQAQTNEVITFDASASYDNDGQITQYLWNFGDGNSSSQMTTTHAYSQPNTYTYSLTVTDNQGATGQTSGQITISGTSSNLVTVTPSSGTISPGGSQLITLTLDASTLQNGNYTGQVLIATNGGNITIPIDYLVNVEKLSSVPAEFELSQNYPNPFNPSTKINYKVPRGAYIKIKLFDALGKELGVLEDGYKNAGVYEIEFSVGTFGDGSNLSSGVYYYCLHTQDFIITKKMVLLR